MVYVISISGRPLMPTAHCGKVKHLLKDGKAKVVHREPFTIQLLYETTEYTQATTLGVDTGSGTFGAAVVTDDSHKVLYISEVEVRNDISKKMKQRSKYRRNRRYRKTRYRKARFDNRKSSIKNDRFSPTMQSKINAHEREIKFVKSILPVTHLVLETGTFDMALMNNPALADPEIARWGYQKGPNYGFANTKAMVRARDGYTCAICKGRHKNRQLDVHHIIFRNQGGSNEAENLITLCQTCHKKLHNGEITYSGKGKKKGSLSFATQMNSIRKQLLARHPEAIETFGYITSENCQLYGLPKAHCIDAAVIASDVYKPIFATQDVFYKRCIAKGTYQCTKGVRSEKSMPKTKIEGFKQFDKVKYQNGLYFIKGRMSSGYAVLSDIYGTKIDFPHVPKLKEMQRIAARKSIICTTAKIDLKAS